MFEFKSKATSTANIDKLWNNYKEVRNWKEWDSSVENVVLHGEFEEGTKGVLKSVGMPPLDFELIEVNKRESFTNQSVMGPFSVKFTHVINTENDVVTIEHGLIVTGPDENKTKEIGNGIASTIPSAMEKLLEISK